MPKLLSKVVLAGLAALALAAGSLPASAHDGDHAGPGSTGPDRHSQNVKLLANVARSASATQSDLAFDGKLVYAGNYLGFRVIDVSDPEAPQVISDFKCNGAQGDVSVYGGLLFQSVDSPQSNPTCNSSNTSGTAPGAWEGVRIFDVSNPAAPVHLNSVATDCGSHTHTLVPDAENDRVLVYVSSYPLSGLGPNCQRPHGFVSIIDVPLANPLGATVSKYFLDPATEVANFSTLGAQFVACHDISVFTAIDRAAAACLSEAQVWDISDPANPQFLYRFDNPAVNNSNIDLWHSATFSWDAKVVAFGDESGGGTAARCVDPNDQQGRIWFLDLATGDFLGDFKIPRSESGVCTMHNFNFVPLSKGRKVLVSSSYTGGTTVVDVNDPTNPTELGFYQPSGANTWSSYWYNGWIFANDILRGVDIFNYTGSATAGARKLDMLNPQTQTELIQ